jgi:endonuclease YncB( thermonuclease family)
VKETRGEARGGSPPALRAALALAGFLGLAACAPPPQSPAAPPAREPAKPAAEARGGEESARVARADDGDSVTLEGGGQVRYLGIDAPERGEPCADLAREENRKLVAGRTVRLERAGSDDTDRHGRRIRAVYVDTPGGGESVCVNVALVRAGLALTYVASDRAVDEALLRRLLDAQGEAIDLRRNIWRGILDAAPGARDLVSSRWRIHRANCSEIAGRRLRPVSSAERELRSGKSPCRSCGPLR